jgi:hypothetical protein
MYEQRHHPLLPWPLFLRRAGGHVAVAGGLVGAVATLGTCGYRYFAGLPWLDAFLNASMILSGMGPVDRLPTSGAKLFAALYALFSGLVFVAVMGIVLGPWVHRLFHRLHLESDRPIRKSRSGMRDPGSED